MDAYFLAPGPKSLLSVFDGEHQLGGICGYDSVLTTDENPQRVAAVGAADRDLPANRVRPPGFGLAAGFGILAVTYAGVCRPRDGAWKCGQRSLQPDLQEAARPHPDRLRRLSQGPPGKS
jgi:hypothetical protein